MKNIVFILSLVILFQNAFSQKFIRLERKENSFVSKRAISSAYKNKDQINLVLRNSVFDFTTSNSGGNRYSANLLFNTIEKELIKRGINVKDGALYKKDGNTEDVDILIDLANVNRIEFNTNRYYNKKDAEKTSGDLEKFSMKGYSFDFRIVDAHANEVLGFYTFNYTPCTDGCEVKISKNGIKMVEKKYEKFDGAYEVSALEDVVFNEFYAEVAYQLVAILKQNSNVKSLIDEEEEVYDRIKSNVNTYFPESHFFDNLQTNLIDKNKYIHVTLMGGEDIFSDIETVFTEKGYKITTDVKKAGYFLFAFKGEMQKSAGTPECIQFQLLNAKTYEKLSGCSYKFKRGWTVLDYVAMFVDSL